MRVTYEAVDDILLVFVLFGYIGFDFDYSIRELVYDFSSLFLFLGHQLLQS